VSRGFSIVVAADASRGIGKGGGLPWRLPGEMAYFKRVTTTAAEGTRNAVIMGRKTFESIPAKFRPLPGRLNVVLSRLSNYEPSGAEAFDSLDGALTSLLARPELDQLFVIGGGALYEEALAHPACQRVFVTRVHATFACDTHLAEFESSFERIQQDGPHTEQGLAYTFEVYERRV
jgi:dihydrofolate reductase